MHAIACWPDGGVLVDGILIRLEPERCWYVQPDSDFFGWVSGLALGLDVQISDPQSWVQQIQGPKALDVLADACDDGMPEPFRYFDARHVSMGGQRVLITRTGWTAEVGFEIYTHPDLDFNALWDHVTNAGARHSMVDIGLDPMDTRRIEGEILNNGSDMDRSMTPFEAGLGAFVEIEKPDFIGKAALEAADRRTRIYGIACSTAEPLIGGPVTGDGREIGTVTAASWSPLLEQGIGYVRLASADDLDPRSAQVTGFDLTMHDCDIVDLPFYDAKKEIPRGLAVQNVLTASRGSCPDRPYGAGASAASCFGDPLRERTTTAATRAFSTLRRRTAAPGLAIRQAITGIRPQRACS